MEVYTDLKVKWAVQFSQLMFNSVQGGFEKNRIDFLVFSVCLSGGDLMA